MKVMITFEPNDDRDFCMAVASVDEWSDVLQDLNGIGHSPATMKLISQLNSWGVKR